MCGSRPLVKTNDLSITEVFFDFSFSDFHFLSGRGHHEFSLGLRYLLNYLLNYT